MKGIDAAPQSAYIHVPFCRHRCGYCNFTLVANRDDLVEDYLRAVEVELNWLETPRPVETLFLGGGTPTHLSAAQLTHLISLAQRWFPLAEDGEFSIEANPADVTAEKFDVLASLGVTRVSLGVQSFATDKLMLLERDHHAQQVENAVQICQNRFASTSCDLIFGAPNETLTNWQDDLARMIDLQPDHISTYGLTFERGTSFWTRRQKRELHAVDEEIERSMYLEAIDRLTTSGYDHYEVSNFAKSLHRCRHNLTYWRGESYFAIGPGAASYLDGVRQMNHRSTTTYLKRVLAGDCPIAEQERLSPPERARERLVFGLRMIGGINRESFQRATGFDIDELCGPSIAKLQSLGLVARTGSRLQLTREGLLVSDSVSAELLQ